MSALKNLEKCFYDASQAGEEYVGVKIEMQGFPEPEIIINKSSNFDKKLAYYKKAYNEDLTLKTFNGIKIIGFASGDTFAEIEYELVHKEEK